MNWVIFTLGLLTAHIVSANDNNSSIKGFWLNETKEYIVEVSEDDSIFSGRIVWLADSLDMYEQPLRDVLNDDPEKRSRKVLGMDILTGFIPDNGMWKHGKVYNFKSGSDYNARMKLDEEGHLRLTGYYGILFFLGKTKVWTPVNNPQQYGLD